MNDEMKTKRIKALVRHITRDNIVWESGWAGSTEPCYVLRQSDVRALAEQMANNITRRAVKKREAKGDVVSMSEILEAVAINTECILYAWRLHGIRPGQARKGKQ